MAGEMMLATVRVARGLTQAQLARQTGISQATLSKAESGLVQLDAGRLELLARVLNIPVELASKPVDFAGPQAVVFHRKRASLPVSASNRLRATLDLVHLQVGGLLDEACPVIIPRIPLPHDGLVTPEEVAQEVRQALEIPAGPIESLISVLENSGVGVVHRDLGSLKVDALMSWPPGRRPVVLLGCHAPGDRQRFSLAHELGHAVMHQVPREDQESEADRFAAEFLMPSDAMRRLLGDVSVPKLARLKVQWGVSMAALLRRARDLGELTDSQYRRMNIEFSQAGYRMREPVDVGTEKPVLLGKTVQNLVGRGLSYSDLAHKSWMSEDDFREHYLREDAA